MKIEVFKPTQDDFYSNYSVGCKYELVKVIFTQTGPNPKIGNGMYRVCVWGNDDFGLEIHFTEETTALNMFHQVIGWKYVNIQQLRDTGFVTA